MSATAFAWIAGLCVAVLGGAAALFFSYWLGRCPRCKSMSGPKGVMTRPVSSFAYAVQWACRDCGHHWEELSTYME